MAQAGVKRKRLPGAGVYNPDQRRKMNSNYAMGVGSAGSIEALRYVRVPKPNVNGNISSTQGVGPQLLFNQVQRQQLP